MNSVTDEVLVADDEVRYVDRGFLAAG